MHGGTGAVLRTPPSTHRHMRCPHTYAQTTRSTYSYSMLDMRGSTVTTAQRVQEIMHLLPGNRAPGVRVPESERADRGERAESASTHCCTVHAPPHRRPPPQRSALVSTLCRDCVRDRCAVMCAGCRCGASFSHLDHLDHLDVLLDHLHHLPHTCYTASYTASYTAIACAYPQGQAAGRQTAPGIPPGDRRGGVG